MLAQLSHPRVIAVLSAAALLGLGGGLALYLGSGGGGSGPAGLEGAVNTTSLFNDTDLDGLPDLLENYVYGSDPLSPFSQGGTVPDGYLARHGLDPSDPGAELADAAYPGPGEAPEAFGPNGLDPTYRMTVRETYLWERPDDWNETTDGPFDNGLDPTRWDAGAGLAYSWAIHHGLDPFDAGISDQVLAPLPEGDGLSVRRSYETATDPRALDTDGDGLADHREIQETDTDPSRFDSAGHGVADGWAVRYGLDPRDPQMPLADPDLDGLSNAEEFAFNRERFGLEAALAGEGLSPKDPDTAGTGIPEGWLVREGLDPFEEGIGSTVLQRARDHGPAAARGVPQLVLTVRDAYRFARPAGWSETVDGPWTGGLRAATNDTDGDGLPDAVELAGWSINVTLGSGTGERVRDLNVSSDPTRADTDLDGLLDLSEFLGRVRVGEETIAFPPTDPRARDTDFDDLSDRAEVVDVAQRAQAAGVTGRLDPTVQDSDGDTLTDGAEFRAWTARAARYRGGATAYEYDNRDEDGVLVLGEMPGAKGPGGVATRESIARALEPWGDLDADGLLNVLDPDADEDGLLDGWEVEPSNYARSPFAADQARAASDPANADTDGDELPDGWEVRFGRYDASLDGWNLDPAKWDSFGDGIPDGERDLDDDSIAYTLFHAKGVGFEAEERPFNATNLVEYRHDTDPNRPSTSESGLDDGWTIFWGVVYPELSLSEVGDVYPGAPGAFLIPSGAPRPTPTQDLDAVTDELAKLRFSTDNTPRSGESLDAVFARVQDATTGEVRDVYRFKELRSFRFADEQRAGTNPYLQDSDGDGLSDVWETAFGTSPIAFERDADPDEDGLTNLDEFVAGTDPSQPDTDLGGASDAEETAPGAPTSALDPSDDVRLRDPTADSDGDGIPDVAELRGWEHPTLGSIQTDPNRADTDGDGLLDGDNLLVDPSTPAGAELAERLRERGARPTVVDEAGTLRFPGEVAWKSDPRLFSSAGDDVPDGWKALHSRSPGSRDADLPSFYALNRPAWWVEATMGPWWWGYGPGVGSDEDADGLADWSRLGGRIVARDRDLDQDGLDDLSGEDPTPGVGSTRAPSEGFPHAGGLVPAEVLHRAQAFGPEPAERTAFGTRDVDADGVQDVHDRLPARLSGVSWDVPKEEGRLALEAGKTYTVTGRVEVSDRLGRTVPVHNATVVVHLFGPARPIGLGVTDAGGRFALEFAIAEQHTVDLLPPSGAFLGRVLAPISWTSDLTGLTMGDGSTARPNALRLQVLNTTGAAAPGEPTRLDVPALLEGETTRVETTAQGIRGLVGASVPFRLTSRSNLTLGGDDVVAVGAPIEVGLILEDTAGQPVPNATIILRLGDLERTVSLDAEGRARERIPGVTAEPGDLDVHARYAGDRFVRGAEATRTIAVRHPVELTLEGVSPVPARAGEPVAIEGRLKSAGPLEGRRVQVSIGTDNAQTVTDATGRFSSRITLSPEVSPGTVPLTLRFAGDDSLGAAELEEELPVRAVAHIVLTPPEEDLTPESVGRLLVTVTDGTGRGLPGDVGVRGLPGAGGPRTVRVGTDGLAELEWRTSREPGAHPVTARRAGDDTHLPATAQAWVHVRVPAFLLFDRPTLFRGQGAALSGTLEDALGEPVAGGEIVLRVGERALSPVFTDDEGRFVVRWLVDRALPLGNVPFLLTYTPTEADPWLPAEVEGALEVRSSVLVSPARPEVLRSDPQLELSLVTDTGSPVPDGTLALRLPSLDVGTDAPVRAGRASLRLPLSPETPVGAYPARLTLSGAAGLTLPPQEVDLLVTSPVTLEVSVPERIGRGESLQVRVRALDDRGARIGAGVAVVTLFEGRPALAPLGQDGGVATVSVPADAPTGTTRLHVAWSGPPGYLNTTATAPVHVLKATHIILELPPDARPGSQVAGTVRLTSGDGTPLPDRRVLVREPGSTTAVFLTTDEAGEARVLLRTGTLHATSLEVLYAGDEAQARAATNHTLAVRSAAPGEGAGLALAGAGVLALGLVLAAALWAHRRRSLQRQVADVLDRGAGLVLAGNEYRAAVLQTYKKLVAILAAQGVVESETQTLREYQEEVRRRLGLESEALRELFDVFDETFYARGAPSVAERSRALAAFREVAQDLRKMSGGPTFEEVTSPA